MRKVMRPRFYCEHCGKGGGSGGHIRRHEEACTKNPNRKCRMCATLLEQGQPDLDALMGLLPTVEQQKRTRYSEDGRHSWDQFEDIPEEAVKALREAAGKCPACMMAAIRQRGLPVTTAESFNFTEECKAIWAEINNKAYEEEVRAYQYGGY
jgi:hypothetical protein